MTVKFFSNANIQQFRKSYYQCHNHMDQITLLHNHLLLKRSYVTNFIIINLPLKKITMDNTTYLSDRIKTRMDHIDQSHELSFAISL